MAEALRVLLVDDEAPARARLKRLLLAHPEVQVIAEARDGAEALQLVARHQPDALFLDVQMPGVDGLAVAASLPEPAPAVVFVSAHDHYALRAFDAAAVDYLLKPADAALVARAVQRLHSRAPRGTAAAMPAPEQLLIAERGHVQVVKVAEITWLEAADNYVVLHTAGRAPLMRRTLAGLLADLGEGFVRTQRGAAVALAQVREVVPLGRGDAQVRLEGGATVPCSRQYRAALMDRLAERG
ncbi:MAG: response regulator [Burkholderiaceae bacterium]